MEAFDRKIREQLYTENSPKVEEMKTLSYSTKKPQSHTGSCSWNGLALSIEGMMRDRVDAFSDDQLLTILVWWL